MQTISVSSSIIWSFGESGQDGKRGHRYSTRLKGWPPIPRGLGSALCPCFAASAERALRDCGRGSCGGGRRRCVRRDGRGGGRHIILWKRSLFRGLLADGDCAISRGWMRGCQISCVSESRDTLY